MKKFSLSFKFFVLAMALFVGMASSCSLISSSEKKSSGQTSPLPADFVKVKMYLSNAESISRTINPNEISSQDIVKVILSAKYSGETAGESGQDGTSSGTSSASSGPSITEDDFKEYEFLNLDKERVSYLEWNNESVPGKSAYEAFLLDGAYLEKGFYKFTLELYTERSTNDTNEHLSMIAESELIQVTSDTKSINLGKASYAEDGNLCIKFEWNADSGDQSPFEKIEAGLFTLSSKGTEPYDQELYADDPDYNGYKLCTHYFDADNHTYFAYYEENEVPNGTYFIKYRVYSSTGEIINAFMDIVKIKGFKTEKTLTIDLDKVNWKGETKLFDINIKTEENSDIDVTNNSEELKISGTTLIFTAPELDNYTYEWKIDGIVQKDEGGQPVNSNILTIDIYEQNWVSGIYDISLLMKDWDGNILSYSAQLEWTRKIKVDFVTNKEDLEFQTQYFSEGGNLVLKNPALNEDGSLDESKNPTYGWYLDEEMRTPFTSFGYPPMENITLYGRWYLTEIYVQGQGAAGTGEFAEGNTSGSASSGGTGSTGSGTSLAADGSMAHPFTTFNDALEFIKDQKDMIAVNGEPLSSADYIIWIDGYLNTSVEIGHNFTEAGSLTVRGAGFSGADESGVSFDGIGGPFRDDTENPLISLDAVCFKVTSEVPIIIENLTIRDGYSGILAGRYFDEETGDTVDVPVNITLSDGVYVINNNSIESPSGTEADKLSDLELTSLGGGITLCHGNLTFGINEESAFVHVLENSAATGAGLLLLGGSVQISYTVFNNNSAEINGGGLAILGGSAEMFDVSINENQAKEKGAGIYMTGGTFTQKGGRIVGNEMSEECTGVTYGAGVYVGYYEDPETSTSSAATFNMEGGKIIENKSLNSDISLCGAGVYVDAIVDGDKILAGSFNMTGGQIVHNIATEKEDSNGAAIYLASGANLSISGKNNPVTAVNEYAAENEGDLESFYLLDEVVDGSQWPVICSNITTDSESAQNRGGAIYIKGETPDFENNINIKNALILGNSAPYGGAIAAKSSEGTINITMEDAIIYNNTAMSWDEEGKYGGGAIFLEAESESQINFTMKSGIISKNGGAGYGGAICLYNSKFVMNNGIIGGDREGLGNYTTDEYYGSGGAVFINSDAEFVMNGGSIKYNSARISNTMGGGAVNVYSGKFTMNDGEISNNTSNYNGGGVYIGSSGEFCMKGGLITGNTANEKGNGVYQNETSTDTGVFKMGGSAKIASDNDVYIPGVVTVIGKLTEESPVATLSPKNWNTVSTGETDATQLILLDENIDTVSEAEGLETTSLAEASQAFAVKQPADESRSYFVTESGKLDWK